MPMQGAVDTLAAKPRFPKERVERGAVTLVAACPITNPANVASYFGNSTINFVSAAGVANGYFVSGINVGNTVGSVGFNLMGPSVVNVQGTLVTLSRAIGGNIANGGLITFSKPLTYKSNTSAVSYNANTYLVGTKRVANSNNFLGLDSAHTGWTLVKPQTGYVKAVNIRTAGNQYGASAVGYLTFTANSTYIGGTGANVYYTTNANGAIISAQVNATGVGYTVTPSVVAPFSGIAANAVNAVFTITMGGRANRVLTEVLSITSNANVSDPLSGGIWFPGL